MSGKTTKIEMNVPGKVTKVSLNTIIATSAILVSIGAGLYLLTSGSEESTVFDALLHGVGAYFIARGLWMAAQYGQR